MTKIFQGPIFAASSFWYQKLPANPTPHENSANFTAEFMTQLGAASLNPNDYTYSPAIYVADKFTPRAKVIAYCPPGWNPDVSALQAQWNDVPIPPGLAVPKDDDAQVCIYCPDSDEYYEFYWMYQGGDGNWNAAWGGKISNASANPGIWPNKFGATATSLSLAGGIITPEELLHGKIDHVIGLALRRAAWPDPAATGISWPATRSDGYNPSNLSNQIPEGLRGFLPAGTDLSGVKYPAGRAVAETFISHGCVAWDKTDNQPSIRFVNPLSYTQIGLADPYPVLLGGVPEYNLLAGIPFDKMQWLPMNFGKPA